MKNILCLGMLAVMISFSLLNIVFTQDLDAEQDYSTIGFDIMQKELDYFNKDILPTLGQPDLKSEYEMWGADGLEHQEWTYKTKGITLDMVKEDGVESVNSITIKNPAEVKTTRNVGINSTNQEVFQAYKNEFNPEESDLKKIKDNDPSEYSVTAGTCYGGILFTINGNKVKEIFIGAGAE